MVGLQLEAAVKWGWQDKESCAAAQHQYNHLGSVVNMLVSRTVTNVGYP